MNQNLIIRKALWGQLFDLGEEILQGIDHLLPSPNAVNYGKILKLDVTTFNEHGTVRVLGIKKFEDGIYLLCHLIDEEDSTHWEYLASDELEFPESTSRIDLLMWYLDTIEGEYNLEESWCDDNTNVDPSKNKLHAI